MNTTEFLSRLRERSIRLWADGGDSLNYEGPPGALTPDLLTELRKRKPEILAYLHRVRLDVPEIPIAPVARDQPLPLSFAQQRLWFLDRLGAGWAYNMPAAFRLRGALDVEALKSSLAEIVQRHEVLRTTFICPKGKPMQVVSPSGDLSLSFEDLTDLPLEQREEEARRRAREEVRRPFDLVRGPVFRTTLFKLDSSDHVLVLVLHHIAGDGWSVGILLRELSVSYRALLTQSRPTLPDLTVQYADFALWQRGRLQAEKLDQQRAYWKERLGGELPRLELPVDRPRPAVQTFEGGRHEALIPASTYEAVKTLARAQGITSAIALMAAFRVLLSRYSGQQDIVLGTTIANRNRSDIENLVGCFVNSLVMRVDLAGDPTFEEVLRRERESSLGAYDHQDLPFEQLVEELSPERGLGENPIFQVSFTLQNAPVDPLSLPELECDRFPIGVASSRFDLSALAWETPNGLVVSFIYAVDLFDATSIERLAQLYERVLSAVVNNPQLRVSQVPLLEEAETRRIVVEWNKTAIEYPPTRCVHELFEAEVVRNPDATALVDAQETLSYRTLNSRANQIARYLRSIGIGPESRVGVVAHRSAQTVTGILGVLKAGAAYVPVDPASPPKRNQLILEGAGVSVLIGPGSMGEAFPGRHLASSTSRRLRLRERKMGISSSRSGRRISPMCSIPRAPRAYQRVSRSSMGSCSTTFEAFCPSWICRNQRAS